jgi:NAD(P)-dependent dehydrogenase (short-subunit alcohol dehydrogenase family)
MAEPPSKPFDLDAKVALVTGGASGIKGALLGLSRASAFELADFAITVNTVLPGGVATAGAIGAKGPAAEGPARRQPPLGRCEPRDIAAAVLFFASPAARYITNQVLTVDGGWSVT